MHAQYSEEYNKFLLSINAFGVNFEKLYRLSSGLEIPFYCDNRLIFSYHHIFEYAVHALRDMMPTYFPEVDVIAGVSTAGIPHGSVLSYLLMKPFIYIRPDSKAYGKGNKIEGIFERGKKVLIIEDLVFSGEASLQAVNAVRDAGGEVVGVFSLFSYNLQVALEAFKLANVPFCSLTHFTSFIETAQQEHQLSLEIKQELLTWHTDPFIWKAPMVA